MSAKIFTRFAALAVAALLSVLTYFPAHAQSGSDYLENKSVDLVLRGQAWTPAATLYWGLSTTACSDSATGTEVSTSGTGYARVGLAASMVNWSGTQSAGSTTASTGTGGQSSNNVAISYGTATGSYGTVTHFFAIDTASGAGNIYFCQALTSSRAIGTNDVVSFPINSVSVTWQ